MHATITLAMFFQLLSTPGEPLERISRNGQHAAELEEQLQTKKKKKNWSWCVTKVTSQGEGRRSTAAGAKV
jgi:hypothetical protein